MFNSIIDAENHTFRFMYDSESNKSRALFDEWMKSLVNVSTILSSNPQGTKKRKVITASIMSSNLCLNGHHTININPHNFEFTERSWDEYASIVDDKHASRIQSSVRKHDLIQSNERMQIFQEM